MLRLAEELMLVAFDAKRGGIARAGNRVLPFGLVGAHFMELALAGRVIVESGKCVVADASPTADELLDWLLATIAGSKRRQSLSEWVAKLAGPWFQWRCFEWLQ